MMNLPTIGDALRAQFPELGAAGALRFVGQGFSSVAVSVGEQWIFCIARNADTQAVRRRELAMLPLLQERLPLPIPQPRFYAGPNDAFPYGVIGYPMLAGEPWTLDNVGLVNHERIADQLAEFVSAMHAFPVESALLAGVEMDGPLALVDELTPSLAHHLDALTLRRFHAWWNDYHMHRQRYEYTPRLLHNDLWCENILLAPDLSHAVGVVDFEQMRIGDPVAEFAALRYVDGLVDRVRADLRPAARPGTALRRAAARRRDPARAGRAALCPALSGDG